MGLLDPRGKVIYLDMDGVMTNFVYAATAAFNSKLAKDIGLDLPSVDYDEMLTAWPKGEYDIAPRLDLDTNQLWELVARGGVAFWRHMRGYDGWRKFYASLTEIPDTRVIICTSPGGRGYGATDCVKGKLLWLQDNLGYEFRDYIFTKHKEQLARPGATLIDDSDSNCDKFIKAGGSAWLLPRVWNSATIPNGIPCGATSYDYILWLLEGMSDV